MEGQEDRNIFNFSSPTFLENNKCLIAGELFLEQAQWAPHVIFGRGLPGARGHQISGTCLLE